MENVDLESNLNITSDNDLENNFESKLESLNNYDSGLVREVIANSASLTAVSDEILSNMQNRFRSIESNQFELYSSNNDSSNSDANPRKNSPGIN